MEDGILERSNLQEWEEDDEEEEEEDDIVFHCCSCNVGIIRNSREHDECWTDIDDDEEKWYCADCRLPSLEDSSDEEEEVKIPDLL